MQQLNVIRERGVCCALPAVEEGWAAQKAEMLKALADPTRLTMLVSLWKPAAPICVCDFTAGLGLSQATISHHMAKLREAGLVDCEKQGIWVYYRLADKLPATTRKLLSQLLD